MADEIRMTNGESPGSALKDRMISAIWLAALGIALGLQVWFPRVDAGPVNDTYNVDIGGRNAFFQFVKSRVPDASRNHELFPAFLDYYPTDATLCVLGPARYPTPHEWKAMTQWVRRGGRLLLAARWEDAELAIPDVDAHITSTRPKEASPLEKLFKRMDQSPSPPKDSGGGGTSGQAEKAETSSPPAAVGPKWTSLLPDTNFTWKSGGTVEAPGAEPLIKLGESVQAARISVGAGTIVLVASDQIFSNAALFERGTHNGLLATRLLQAAGPVDDVIFDESLNATGNPVVVGILLDPVLRPTTVQVIVVLVIFLWRGNRRFGGVLPGAAPARHDVADHTNSLGNLYYKAHHATGVLREYVEQLRTDLRLRFTAGLEQRVLARIANKLGIPVEDVQKQLAEADAATRRPKLTRREAAAQIRRLAILRQAARK